MAEIRSLCVYCGSSPGGDPVYVECAEALGRILAREKIKLVYGGGSIGLMGALASACLAAGGHVTGVIPDFLIAREQALELPHNVIVTRDMHDRKRTMFELADAFVALPGGIGTLEELVEQMTWLQLGRHKKPLAILNVRNYWQPFLALLAHQEAQGFLRRGSFDFLVAERAEGIVPILRDAARAISDEELRNGRAKLVVQEM